MGEVSKHSQGSSVKLAQGTVTLSGTISTSGLKIVDLDFTPDGVVVEQYGTTANLFTAYPGVRTTGSNGGMLMDNTWFSQYGIMLSGKSVYLSTSSGSQSISNRTLHYTAWKK